MVYEIDGKKDCTALNVKGHVNLSKALPMFLNLYPCSNGPYPKGNKNKQWFNFESYIFLNIEVQYFKNIYSQLWKHICT